MREVQEPTVVRENDEGYTEEHPAFGVAIVNRASVMGMSGGATLFQSDLQHQHIVTLAIKRAERTRSLNRDWVHPRQTLIEIEMSLAQWGELIASQGIGSGVPVTIRYTEVGHQAPLIPPAPRLRAAIAEARGNVTKLVKQARETLAAVEEAFEGKMGVRVLRERLHVHRLTLEHAEGSAEFAIRSVVEATEKVVSQGKADIEAHILRAQEITGQRASIEAPVLSQTTDQKELSQ